MKISTAKIEQFDITVVRGANGKFVCTTKARTTDMSGPTRILSVTSDDSVVAALSGVLSELKRNP